ncbi:MAG: hypothetical protein IJQ68_03325 [Methanobrevibacter sp.]|uniref:hypothetical protein n=1 Tax=Methanobrevibacter sp. TaxID=66852 RepID=UPI0025FCAD73|nr:hypothetical protein [Methanobrevibacter sp.]MBR0271007.1 hypothetical protein [Methanobrevibacter sp.]
MNSKLRLAKTISTFTNPPIICIPLFFIISLVLSLNNLWDFPLMELISIIFASVLPMAIILYWAKKTGNDKDISNREDRFTPLIVGTVSYFIGFLVSWTLGLSDFLTFLFLCYTINTFIVMIITRQWKISIHTTGLSGPVCALIILLGPIGAIFALLYPVLIWSRVTLKKHTMAQAIAGGVQGFFLTAIEMFIFISVFNLNVGNIYPVLYVFAFILAIIFTPVVLGIFSYRKIANALIFYLVEIIGFCFFLAVTPIDVTVIFVLTTIVSIYIANYAGERFDWYNVIR